ncbi:MULTISPECIES: tRNA (N(6)-L-threonylcarbamoyladenosine(37)-C(2))-methylthiotransferase MtaB [Clostridium]|uniref:tRNA (N(6)-L-threonylcarbamoyladenosine(37)-C(2))- methylthiotransferase MtaB n=1 Tax=Clostridium TaxID=1485 RepID=UPI000E4EBFF0|nr:MULTISPECIES: tRNA (N(6)-L-threonylcarbamoyladenosine(37)-C(2))-methylthiotransferase MtaB [Clostridium]RHO92794.1 tRNA (N(6)-L-threonylcarbamoyladenosine(37)-C(2))-methylthiotransferase MtaB [Clostridium sp. AF37-7]MBD9273996.1 tRNA (N(6)-L-threonylcarbamoyladenosine(37)-C(2))-methylthiotransferase MtaB [Clostridium sp.]MCC2169451.1 tRNA (N(6)-L-threonylcarbamoyladenosine(37)-C(2))-methylthiotransferase MtaB [Clostridium fessum]RHP43397.1 tRNA (N(6)-L-threonylcarbamoyladenosine(37)-C(2))-me
MRKAAFHNLGCKVNSYETEAMQQLLEDAGYEIVPFREGADVYIINTCSVTNVADRKSRQMLHRAKKMNPSAAVVAVGCYVQAAGAELKKDEAVDLIVGNNQKKDLVQILDDYFADHENSGEILDIGHSQEYEELHIRRIADHTRAFIKVQDGCNQFCSYCIIPYTRGRVRSRRPEDIEHEVRGIAEAGYKEIVLTGIHLSSYGVDFKDEQQENLLTLIKRLDQIPGIERLRLGSLEPRIVTREFAKELARLRTICPHFHLSLQSGCDATLKRMNRRYNAAEYQACCEILREEFDNPAITTDVIVGFPGETGEEFAETERFLKAIHFYEMHIFKYSRRAGTRAADMPDQVPEGIKSVRSDILLALEKQQSLEYRGRFLGTEEEILLEEPIEIDGTKYMMGHTRQYVKGAVPYEEGLKNKTVKGIFTKALNEEVLLLESE